MVGDGNPVPLRPDLAAKLPEKQQIPADPPQTASTINPLFVAIPAAAIAFIAAFFLLGGKGRRRKAPVVSPSELPNSPEMGKDFRS